MKTSVDDLALFGGPPVFPQPLHVGQPNLPDREMLFARFGSCLDRRWLTNNGPLLQEFERRIAAELGVKHCVAMSNGTAALEIAMRALELDGEVILPAFTFVATAHALQWQQIRPVFCDVDPSTHLIDPACIETLITPKTTGIVGVHLWGRGCDVAALTAIARRYRLKLLFDASHAFGCSAAGWPIGGFGDVEVFSFHATKFVSCIEGGVATTNSDELAERMELMRNFGFETYDRVVHVGVNGKMNEFEAAFGLGCLESMDRFLETNLRNYREYEKAFSKLPGVRLRPPPAGERTNWQYVVAEIDPLECPLPRDVLLEMLWKENVRVRRYFYPGCHRMEPYRTLDPYAELRLPVTEAVCGRVLQFPTGTGVSAEAIREIGSLLEFAIRNADLVREAGQQCLAVNAQ